MEMSDNHCKSCGNALQPGDRFCQHCGSPVDALPIYVTHTQTTKPKEGEPGFVHGPQRQPKYGAMILLGIGLLLIAAALGYGALFSGAPAITAPTAAPPSTPTRELTAMAPGPAVLQDRLVYFRTSTSPPSTSTAIPKDPNDAFLVIVLGLPSNSDLYPEDLDWTVLDQAGREFGCVGFGIPLQAEQTGAAVFSLFGPLIKGPVPVDASSGQAAIVLIFVVPKEVRTGTLLSPQEQEFSFSALDTSFRLDNAMLSTVKIDGSFIQQPNGSENWTLTP
jgi:hypothetical protein